MSRSKRKGSKGYGWEYWGKRPLKGVKGDRGSGGTENKRHGIQRERAILKREANKEPTEPEYDPREWVPEE